MKTGSVISQLSCLIALVLPFFLYSCGASSTVRYERQKEKKETIKKTDTKIPEEDFDITQYRTEIDIKAKTSNTVDMSSIDAWYGYEKKDTSQAQEKAIISTAQGFRVQVLATDNLEEADSLKSELSGKVIQKNIYVIFDPPFYKVEVGDFVNMGDARDLDFKLNQMGYTESRVIASTVNIFE
ncbi:MAG TPA: SPOR domain-containing protein [Ignavibacteriaceae bacterium]